MANESPVLTNLAAFSGDVAQEILTSVVNELDCAKDGEVLTDIPYKLILPKIVASAGARPYSLGENFTETMTGTDETLEIFRAKKDFLIEPERFRTTYLQKSRNGLVDPNAIPFESFLIQQEFIKFLSEINDTTAWLGVHNAAGAGAIDIANGWGTDLIAMEAASKITPEVLGTIDGTNCGAQFETLWSSQSVARQNMDTLLYCSYARLPQYIAYARANWNLNFQNYNPKVDTELFLPISRGKCKIRFATWLGTSDAVFITPQSNLKMGVGFPDTSPTLEVVQALSALKCRINYFVGFKIADPAAIVINDSAIFV